jgi:hypothetical protein
VALGSLSGLEHSMQKCSSQIRRLDCRKRVAKAPEWSSHGGARQLVVRYNVRPAENGLM